MLVSPIVRAPGTVGAGVGVSVGVLVDVGVGVGVFWILCGLQFASDTLNPGAGGPSIKAPSSGEVSAIV